MSAVHRVTVFSATQRARELYGNALAKYSDSVESRLVILFIIGLVFDFLSNEGVTLIRSVFLFVPVKMVIM